MTINGVEVTRMLDHWNEPTARPSPMAKAKRINLALQGGGAHGAFTWGVLDRLLEGDEIEIAGISGTSAGALNGAALKAGWRGAAGRRRARTSPGSGSRWARSPTRASRPGSRPWPQSPSAARSRPPCPSPSATASRAWSAPTPPGRSTRTRCRRIVERFHYDEVCGDPGPAFHICATNVRTGKIRVFTGDEIGPEAIMASACLPTLFKAVEIPDRRDRTDGGLLGRRLYRQPRALSRCSRRTCPATSWW
jgi:NTE family protein